MKKFKIEATDKSLLKDIQHKIDNKTKPLGALGQLESIATKISLIQQSIYPKLESPSMLVFAGDHGLAEEGISAYPSEVTHQMVLNFLYEGAAINVFCDQHDIDLSIIDAGVNFDFGFNPKLINRKIAFGSKNSLKEAALTDKDFEDAIQIGCSMTNEKYQSGCNIIGFGEMGIGNTSASSLLMAEYLNLDIKDCVGRGTGVDDQGLIHKTAVLQKVFAKHTTSNSDPIAYFKCISGLEMAMMLGAMLQAAENKMTILIDGFIATSVLLAAFQVYPNILDYTLYCHQSDESGHKLILDSLNAESILKLDLRLGEGTGCAVAYPIIASSVNFLNQMASFESASVSNKS